MDGWVHQRIQRAANHQGTRNRSWRQCPLQLKIQMNLCLWLKWVWVSPKPLLCRSQESGVFSHSFSVCLLTTQIYCCNIGFISFISTPHRWNLSHEPWDFVESWCPLSIQSCPCISPSCVSACALSAFYSVCSWQRKVEEGKITVRKFICCDSSTLFSIPAEEKDSKVLHLWH